MKLTIGDYEIDIKAKYKGNERNSKTATMNFLFRMRHAFYESARNHNNANHKYTAKQEKQFADDIYSALKETGFYK